MRPDVVLCDIGLPVISGYDVARALSSDDRLAGCHLVAVSGHAHRGDVDEAHQAGFDRHIPKPVELDPIDDIIAQAPGIRSRKAAPRS